MHHQKQRNLIERFFNELKQFKQVGPRLDRRVLDDLATRKLAFVRL